MSTRRPSVRQRPVPRETARRLRELQLLHETARRLTSLLHVEDLLPEMVEQLRAVLGVEIVSIMLLDESQKVLRIQAAAGLPKDIVDAARVPIGEGISGQVVARGEAVLIQDMARDSAFVRSAYHAQYTTESLLCVPLRLGPRTFGVINVNNKLNGESLDENDLALVSTFSAQAVLALENSRLYAHLEAEVARVTAELKQSNDELRVLTEFNEGILRNMGSGLVAVDLAGRITKLNASAAALLGAEPEAAVGKGLAAVFGDVAAAEVLAEPVGHAEGRREVQVTTALGRDVRLGYGASALLDAEGRRSGTIIIFRDLTQLKKMEGELVRMDRLASLGVLGAGIAHEIRNPLAAIRFNLDFLREAGGAQSEIDVILKNVARLDDLVKKLLRFARPQPPAFWLQSLGARVEAVVALIGKQAAAQGVRIRVHLDPSLGDAWIDAQQAEQVVLNVALNAVQAMPHGGSVVISTRRAPRADRSAFVEVLVSDEGPGLSREQAEQVFDPFFTTREEGTGLGLAVAHRIMQDHGGYIEVAAGAEGRTMAAEIQRRALVGSERPPGPGTTFILGFALEPAPTPAAAAATPTAPTRPARQPTPAEGST